MCTSTLMHTAVTQPLLPLTQVPTPKASPRSTPLSIITFIGIYLLPGTLSLLQCDIIYGDISQVA